MAKINWGTVKENVNSLILWTYWIVGIVIAFTISYVLYTRFNKQVASLLVFIATMMALYYYYVKWFVIGQPLPIPAQTCPDYMESIGTVGSDQFVCVDKKGKYPNFTASAQTIQTIKADPSFATNSTSAGGIVRNGTLAYVVTPSTSGTTTEVVKTFCNDLKAQSVSWINLCNYI
jgi:hypothetical protein